MVGKMKFLKTSSLQAVTVLILLSGTVESLQCYWCGPLAEQVHRSLRAPSCGAEDHVTVCEPGYTHCAVVASSPPFVESRYCVKFYQDECYTLYCNSTKTFRMTCPCRGELCNGPNTQREIDAFAILAKEVAITQNTRIKKRNAILSKNFNTKDKIVNLLQTEDVEENTDNVKSNMDTVESAVENEISEHIQVSNFTNDNKMQSDQRLESSIVDNTETMKHEEINNKSFIYLTSMTHFVSNVTDMIKTTTSAVTETGKEHDVTTQKSEESVNNNPDIAVKASDSPILQTTVAEENSFISNDIKPSMELPTAEALQQNDDPLMTTEKPTELTSTEILTTTVAAHGITSKKSTNATRNSAIGISVGSMFIIFNSLIIVNVIF